MRDDIDEGDIEEVVIEDEGPCPWCSLDGCTGECLEREEEEEAKMREPYGVSTMTIRFVNNGYVGSSADISGMQWTTQPWSSYTPR